MEKIEPIFFVAHYQIHHHTVCSMPLPYPLIFLRIW